MRCLKNTNKKLLSHQNKLVKFFIKSKINGMLALWQTGTGKTLLAVSIIHCYINNYIKKKIIIITPASLLITFKKEVLNFKKISKNNLKQIYFFTYEGFLKSKINCNNSLIIIDEAQYLKSSQSKKTIKILKCAQKSNKILLLSATPFVNNLYDIEPLMAMIDKRELFNKYIFNKILNDKHLLKNYFNCKINFYKNDPKKSLKFFPKKKEIFYPIIMNNKSVRLYNQVNKNSTMNNVNNFFDLNKNDKRNFRSFWNGVRRISGGNIQKILVLIKFIKNIQNKTPNKKIGLTAHIIKTHTEKIIIFNHFKKTGSRLIINSLNKNNIKYKIIDGSVPKIKRNIIVDQYVNGNIKVLILSSAGSTGLNLLETGYVFILTPSWNKAEQIQTIARAIRYKSHFNLPKYKWNVLIIHLLLIQPHEKSKFDLLIKDKIKYENIKKNMVSIDIKMTVDALRKQKYIDKFLNKISKFPKKCKKIIKIQNIINKKNEY